MRDSLNLKLTSYSDLLAEKNQLVLQLSDATDLIATIRNGEFDALVFSEMGPPKELFSNESSQVYKTLIEEMPGGVASLLQDSTITYCNTTFSSLLNRPIEELAGSLFLNLFSGKGKMEFANFVEDEHVKSLNVTISGASHSEIQSYLQASILKVTSMIPAVLIVNLIDITQQINEGNKLQSDNCHLQIAIEASELAESNEVITNKELHQTIKNLEETNNSLSTLARTASHDMQEPLRKIITYGSILNKEYAGQLDEQGKCYIKIMQTASERMSKLIADVTEYSDLFCNVFEFKYISLESIVLEMISNLELQIQDASAIITIEKGLPSITANPGQMLQLFQNIIGNALKFSRPGVPPEIQISYKTMRGKDIENTTGLEAGKHYYSFCIKDNGIGFDIQYEESIYKTFTRLNGPQSYDGSGIGLSICKKIVDYHHGTIKAKSKLNIGSTFNIILPVRQNEF